VTAEPLTSITPDAALVRQLAAANGLDLAPDRAAALVPFLAGLLAADARLAALNLQTLPAAGPPWAPFVAAGAGASEGLADGS
jgi:hypothetical protein